MLVSLNSLVINDTGQLEVNRVVFDSIFLILSYCQYAL